MLLILALVVVAVPVLALLAQAAVVLLARAPANVASIRLGPAAAERSAIPRVIWTYWDHLPPPAFVASCLQLWQRMAPDHEVRLVDRATASGWLGTAIDAASFAALPAYRQADWLRLQLLIRHGGIWMDGSTLLTTGLDWVHAQHDRVGAGVVGFYIERYTTDAGCPIVENWFLAAPPNDPFIVDWARELDHALSLGEQGYVDSLRRDEVLAAAAQGIPPDMQSYLIMHLAASRVLQRQPGGYRLLLQRAEDVAFAFHARLRWRKTHLYARLALTPAPRRPPVMIKLRSPDRAVVEKHLARGRIWRRSLLARLLETAARPAP